jgi:hypothetical protein
MKYYGLKSTSDLEQLVSTVQRVFEKFQSFHTESYLALLDSSKFQFSMLLDMFDIIELNKSNVLLALEHMEAVWRSCIETLSVK